MRALSLVFALLLIVASAHAQTYRGNDTLTLSVGSESEAHQIATEFCARGDKYRIVRVHGRYGDEIAINCLAEPPAPRPASVQSGQPTPNPITELSAQFRHALSSFSAAAQPDTSQPETAPPARPERDGTVTQSTYAQPW